MLYSFPMSKVARLVVMWLLAVALPLQGLSAMTMTVCGFDHHGRALITSPMAMFLDGAPTPATHVHVHLAAANTHEHAGAAQTRSDKPNLSKGVAHKCSACGSCCLGAAVSSEAPSFHTAKLIDHFASLVTRTLAAYVTEGLERPPRTFLA